MLIREATEADAQSCGRIFWDAFESIAARHNLPIEPPSPEFASRRAQAMLADDGFVAFVAESDGRVVGSAFVDECASIAGVGPVTVEPAVQDRGIGRALMEAVLQHERERAAAGIRLVQTAYHYRSLSLYAALGFVVREPLSVMQGDPPTDSVPDRHCRPAAVEDLDACDAVCLQVHGHRRGVELRDAVSAGTAGVVERHGQIRGYATGFGYGSHAVGLDNDDLKALLSSADGYMGLGVFVPSRNAELLRWCLRGGLRVVQQSTLMSIGLYNEPAGAYLPSILF
jgi:L-amino acid N-acyltransferase YncA